jgi:hypothetical protein
VQAASGELLVGLDVGGQTARRWGHDHRLERTLEAAVAEAEDGHDQERTKDQAEDGARPAHGIDDLLAHEGQQADDHGQGGPHQASSSGR